MPRNGDSPDEAESVRPGSLHETAFVDPDDPTTAAGYLRIIYRKIGVLETDADNNIEHRKEMLRSIQSNERSNRANQQSIEAQGRTLEGLSNELRGGFEGMKIAHSKISDWVTPMQKSSEFWASAKGLATKVGAVLGLMGAFAGGVIKIWEFFHK